jgi:hypothetical protein
LPKTRMHWRISPRRLQTLAMLIPVTSARGDLPTNPPTNLPTPGQESEEGFVASTPIGRASVFRGSAEAIRCRVPSVPRAGRSSEVVLAPTRPRGPGGGGGV